MSGNQHRDPWVLLGVERAVDDKTIKKAYRGLARQYHPDRNRGDEAAAAMFRDIARAYESIETEDKRTQWLAVNEPGGSAQPLKPLGDDFYDAFGEAAPFTSAPSRHGAAAQAAAEPTAEHDIRRTITIPFRDAYTGTSFELSLDVEEACPTCGGSGAAPGHRPRTCQVCRGTGEHAVGRVGTRCAACQGRGFTIELPCPRCQNGLVRQTRPFVLPIPPGVQNGQVLRVPGPNRGRLGTPDVLVTVQIEASHLFKRTLRDPADLLVEVPISYTEACFGAAVKIPTPEKTIQLRVPAGTMSGTAFRIAEKGMSRTDGGRGDLFARVQVVIPESISAPQKRLIAQLGHYDSDDLRAGLFQKLR